MESTYFERSEGKDNTKIHCMEISSKDVN